MIITFNTTNLYVTYNEYTKRLNLKNKNFIKICSFIKNFVEKHSQEYYMFSSKKLCQWLDTTHVIVLRNIYEMANLGLLHIRGRGADKTAEYTGYVNGHSRYANTYDNIDIEAISTIIDSYTNHFGSIIDNNTVLDEFFEKVQHNKNININPVDKEIGENLYNKLSENISYISYKYIADNKGRLINGLETTPGPSSLMYGERLHKVSEILNIPFNNVIGFDVNGSIYRLSYNMNHTKIFPTDADIYTYIYKYICDKRNIVGEFFPRNKFKKFLMKYYMRDRQGYQVYTLLSYLNPMLSDEETKEKNLFNKELFINIINSNDIIDIDSLPDKDKITALAALDYRSTIYWMKQLGFTFDINDLKTTIAQVKEFNNLIQSTLSELFGLYVRRKQIFFIESNLHMYMLLKFKELGIPVVNVYDCFYGDKTLLNEKVFERVYNESLAELKQAMAEASIPYIQRRYARLKLLLDKSDIIDDYGHKYVKYKGKIITLIDDYQLLEYGTGEILPKEFFIWR